MLVLTRRAGQRIMIGDDIVITVSSVVGNKVRIGIEAPDNVPILRDNAGTTRTQATAKPDEPTRLPLPGV